MGGREGIGWVEGDWVGGRGLGGWEGIGWVGGGWVGSGGRWVVEAGYTFQQDCLEALYVEEVSSALRGFHCLSCDFTWLAKPALEKQTSQLSISI